MIEAISDGVITDEAEIKRYMMHTQSEIQNLSRLVDDLFELTQLDATALTWTKERGSRDLISDTLEHAGYGGKRVELSGWVDPKVDPVPMNSLKCSRCCITWCKSAIRHTPAGGSVAVTAN
jgi:K+-sensing histidine kinase KdpD